MHFLFFIIISLQEILFLKCFGFTPRYKRLDSPKSCAKYARSWRKSSGATPKFFGVTCMFSSMESVLLPPYCFRGVITEYPSTKKRYLRKAARGRVANSRDLQIRLRLRVRVRVFQCVPSAHARLREAVTSTRSVVKLSSPSSRQLRDFQQISSPEYEFTTGAKAS